MNHGSLFNGIGGFQLAAQWMGWNNIFSCEIDDWCNKVTKKHFPNCIQHGDITKTDFTIYRGNIDILTGGFPCQPFSVAGKRKGAEDDRFLWHEMLRAIKEVQPSYIVAENVPGLLSQQRAMVFEQVCSEMETLGYEVQPVIIPACGKDAPHKRERIWIVAKNPISFRCNSSERKSESGQRGQRELSAGDGRIYSESNVTNATRQLCNGSNHNNGISQQRQEISELGNGDRESIVANSAKQGLQVTRFAGKRKHETKIREGLDGGFEQQNCNAPDSKEFGLERRKQTDSSKGKGCNDKLSDGCNREWERNWYEVATEFCGVVDGVSHRVDRLKGLGNAIVPQVAFEIFKAIELVNKNQTPPFTQ